MKPEDCRLCEFAYARHENDCPLYTPTRVIEDARVVLDDLFRDAYDVARKMPDCERLLRSLLKASEWMRENPR